MTRLLKTGTVILLGGILFLSACGARNANQPKPDSVIAAVPTATPALTPTPIPAVLESDPESIAEWVLSGDTDLNENEESDDWVQDDGDAVEDEDQTENTEYYEVGIVEDNEDTDQGGEGNQATALEIADVYSEPGGDPDTIIGTIDADERVTIQGNVDGWFVINYNGQRAYVNSELFS
ncbi:MAG: SH3 domain-containing protein [Lachnospiraceae bacterium]|jgi:hypothetical protein|nr:SH3 domain-containing protein [Lachnospiraceae bacterium]